MIVREVAFWRFWDDDALGSTKQEKLVLHDEVQQQSGRWT
jgi:hypothetical protein